MLDATARQETEKRKRILNRVSALERMNGPELREQWLVLFGSEPPACRSTVLVRRMAHRIQELAYGATSDEVKRRLEERRQALGLNDLGLSARSGKQRKDAPIVGTRFVREWDGQRWEVTVTHDGYEFRGKTYRSLSAIAKAITGTHWNGRAFFGLYRPRPAGKERS